MQPPSHLGHCALVLHTHLPFVHPPDHEDFLEEDWLFEALSECYLPLIEMLRRRNRESLPWHLSLSLTPPLLSMLGIEGLRERFVRFETKRLQLAGELLLEFEASNDPRLQTARHYAERFEGNLKLYEELDRDVAGAFAELAESSSLEILGSGATHGYLPLMLRGTSRAAQVKIGIEVHEEVLGQRPRGFWLPECAYSEGVSQHLTAAGVEWTVLETGGIEGATPTPGERGSGGIRTADGLICFGRHQSSSARVWSSDSGYPGDPAYRELYRDIGFDRDYRKIRPYLKPDGIRRNVGLKFNAVTGDVALHEKSTWDPEAARERARVHGADFIRFQEEELQRLSGKTNTTPLLLCPYDTELFGHWWYEGVWFLEAVFDAAAARSSQPHSILTTPGAFIDNNPVTTVAEPLESSWGEDSCHRVWLNETNQHFWRYLHEMEERMITLAGEYKDPGEQERRLLDQMARELLLAQSSDWLFILTMETSAHYAERRFRDHVHRFFALEDALLASRPIDSGDLERVERVDCLFPSISYQTFRSN